LLKNFTMFMIPPVMSLANDKNSHEEDALTNSYVGPVDTLLTWFCGDTHS